jgi:hypothetical protein
MGAEYYLDINGSTEGPYSFDQLAAMWRDKMLRRETLYTIAGGAHWQPVSSLFDFQEAPPVVATIPRDKKVAGPKDWLCLSCHSVGRPVAAQAGMGCMGVGLLLLMMGSGIAAFVFGFIIPALFPILALVAVGLFFVWLPFSIWRHFQRRKCCAFCGGSSLIPCTSPAASEFVVISNPERRGFLNLFRKA